jgi:hypothetical protein
MATATGMALMFSMTLTELLCDDVAVVSHKTIHAARTPAGNHMTVTAGAAREAADTAEATA